MGLKNASTNVCHIILMEGSQTTSKDWKLRCRWLGCFSVLIKKNTIKCSYVTRSAIPESQGLPVMILNLGQYFQDA